MSFLSQTEFHFNMNETQEGCVSQAAWPLWGQPIGTTTREDINSFGKKKQSLNVVRES